MTDAIVGPRRADRDRVTVYLIERLGNQLFAWAAALAVCRRIGVPCYANLSFFNHVRPRRDYEKRFALGGFANDLVIPTSGKYHRPIWFAQPAQDYAQLWHRHIVGRVPIVGKHPTFVERKVSYDQRIELVDRGTTLVGLFQSWRYFDEIRDEIRERISSLKAPSDWFREVSREIRPGTGSIALNVRRGDYALPRQQQRQGLVGRGYYFEAVSLLRRLGLDGPIYVASDSLDVAMTELRDLEDAKPIDPPPGVDPLEVMILLSRADGLAIANSTFSWWAAYLGGRADQVVVAPRPWTIQARRDDRNLLPAPWLTIDRDVSAGAGSIRI